MGAACLAAWAELLLLVAAAAFVTSQPVGDCQRGHAHVHVNAVRHTQADANVHAHAAAQGRVQACMPVAYVVDVCRAWTSVSRTCNPCIRESPGAHVCLCVCVYVRIVYLSVMHVRQQATPRDMYMFMHMRM